MTHDNLLISTLALGLSCGFGLRIFAFVFGVMWQMIRSLVHSVGGPR